MFRDANLFLIDTCFLCYSTEPFLSLLEAFLAWLVYLNRFFTLFWDFIAKRNKTGNVFKWLFCEVQKYIPLRIQEVLENPINKYFLLLPSNVIGKQRLSTVCQIKWNKVHYPLQYYHVSIYCDNIERRLVSESANRLHFSPLLDLASTKRRHIYRSCSSFSKRSFASLNQEISLPLGDVFQRCIFPYHQPFDLRTMIPKINRNNITSFNFRSHDVVYN